MSTPGKSDKIWYLGLDIGTSSVGWAVTDQNYSIPRIKGKRAWGVRLFTEADTAAERRSFRTARRRLARRKQRLQLLRELLADEIKKQDDSFLDRLADSGFDRVDKRGTNKGKKYSLFNDENYTDRDYHRAFPTVWHLRKYLLAPDGSHEVDIRHYYLAIHHILKHRGHFLYSGQFKLGDNFNDLYDEFIELAEKQYGIYFDDDLEARNSFKSGLKLGRINDKKSQVKEALLLDKTLTADDAPEDIKKRADTLVGLVVGSIVKLDAIFGTESDFKYSVKQPLDEKFSEILEAVGEDNVRIIELAKQLYDWALLDEVMQGHSSISAAFVSQYNQHAELGMGWVKRSDRSKATNKDDKEAIDHRQLKGLFGGVIPHQVHQQELVVILKNLKASLPSITDETIERIESLLTFRIPYYVGPLQGASLRGAHAWVVRRPGHEKTAVRPWNFNEVIDEAASADKFIERMLNDCSYLAGEKCLPKAALLWQEYLVLQDLNNLTVDGKKLDPQIKQKAFRELFLDKKNSVTEKNFREWLVANTYGDASTPLAGVEFPLKHTMSSYHALKTVFADRDESWVMQNRRILDKAIRLITLMPANNAREKEMLLAQLTQELEPLSVSRDELARLAKLRFTGWGSFSETLLEGVAAAGDSVMGYLRSTTQNFMQIINSPDYKLDEVVDELNARYWRETGTQDSWRSLLAESYASAPVKRSVTQSIKIINELIKLQGCKPAKIFVETTRGDGEKGKRTKSRHDKLKDLYKAIKRDNKEVWEQLDGETNQRLQSKALYLYFTQSGRCMYSGDRIDIHDVSNRSKYDIDHIVPQSLLKDDSFNNLVLVKRELNARKTNEHIIPRDMRQTGLWKYLKDSGLISDEKFKRLTRTTEFTENELAGFIERQIVETSQSNKVLADILKTLYQDDKCRLVFHKARLTSEFRRPLEHPEDRKKPQAEKRIIKPEFVKCRELNNLHHAKDAYLTVVCGNVYESVFSSNPKVWVYRNKHKLGHNELNMNRFMAYPHKNQQGELVWSLDEHLPTVIKTMARNDILQTVRTFEQSGGFFDQNVVPGKSAKMPRKTREGHPLSDTRYGGMSGIKGAFFAVVEDAKGKRRITPVPILHKDRPKEYLLEKVVPGGRIIIDRLKFKSLLELDGFPVTIDGTTGSSLAVTNRRPLLLSDEETAYLKKVIKVSERYKASKGAYTIDSFSGITCEENIRLFDVLVKKLGDGYKTRPAVRTALDLLTSEHSRTVFSDLDLLDQIHQLVKIMPLFQAQPFASSSADLKAFGGSKQMGNTSFSSGVKNGMTLVLQSPTGIFEERINLAE